MDDVIQPAHVTGSAENYSTYIGRFHEATLKSLEMVDWEAMGLLGLPDMEERKARYVRLRMDSIALGNPEVGTTSSEPGQEGKGNGGLGALYVLEGSIHGGGVLMKMLRDRNMDDLPTSFLRGFGEESHPMWGRFAKWLQSLDVTTLDLPTIADESKKTFRIFHYQFSQTT